MSELRSLKTQIIELLPVFAETPIQEIAVDFTHGKQPVAKVAMFELFSSLEAVNGCICRLLALADEDRDAQESHDLIREVVVKIAMQMPRAGRLILASKLAGQEIITAGTAMQRSN